MGGTYSSCSIQAILGYLNELGEQNQSVPSAYFSYVFHTFSIVFTILSRGIRPRTPYVNELDEQLVRRTDPTFSTKGISTS